MSQQHGHGPQAVTTFTYDAMGRMRSQTSVAGTSLWVYDAQGRLLSTAEPGVTATQYIHYPSQPASPNASRIRTVISPSGQALHHAYGPAGQLTHQWGPGTYPQRLEYDVYGRLVKLFTYQGGATAWDAVDLPEAFVSQTPSVIS